MLTTKEFFLWLEGYAENMNSGLPSAYQWVEIRRKMLKVNYDKSAYEQTIADGLEDVDYISDENYEAEIGNESMTALYGIFPDSEQDLVAPIHPK